MTDTSTVGLEQAHYLTSPHLTLPPSMSALSLPAMPASRTPHSTAQSCDDDDDDDVNSILLPN